MEESQKWRKYRNMLKLIINKNPEIIQLKVNEILNKEKISTSQLNKQTEFSPIVTKGLFSSERQAIWLNLEEKKDLNEFKKYIKDKNNEEILKSQDLLIITTIHLQGSSPLVKMIEKLKGEVIKDKTNDVAELLESYPLSKYNLDNLKLYIGESAEKAVPLINTLDKMTDEEIKKISYEELLIALPSKPGTVPPYQYTDAVFRGDLEEASFELDRILENSDPILCMVFLHNKIETINRANLLYLSGIKNYKDIAKELGCHPYVVKLIMKFMGKEKVIERLVRTYTILENEMKGESKLKSRNNLLKRYVAEITFLCKGV